MGIMDRLRAGLQVVQHEVNGPHGSYMRQELVRAGDAVSGAAHRTAAAVGGAIRAGRGLAASVSPHMAQLHQGAAHLAHEARMGAQHLVHEADNRVHGSAAVIQSAIGSGSSGKGRMGTGLRGAVNRAANAMIGAGRRAAKNTSNGNVQESLAQEMKERHPAEFNAEHRAGQAVDNAFARAGFTRTSNNPSTASATLRRVSGNR